MTPSVATPLRSLALALAFASAACSGELVLTGPGGGGGGGDTDGEDDDGGDDTLARAMWETDIGPLMTAARPKGVCTTCHQGSGTTLGPTFLGAAAANNFDTIVGTTVIGATPEASPFLTRGDHTGNAFCTGVDTPYTGCTEDETALVAAWIDAVNAP